METVNERTRRTPYFTADTIDRNAAAMLEEISAFREKHPIRLAPDTAVLLILDLQGYFTDRSSGTYVPSVDAIIPRIVRLATLFAAAGRPVIATRHIDEDDPGAVMRRWWRGAIDASDPRSQLIEPLRDLASSTIVKSSYDAFLGTDLEAGLRASAANHVVICGVHAHLCCESTARSAFARGFDVSLAIDGTATYNEGFHRASLLNLAHGFAVPVLCEEIQKAMRQR